MFEYINFFSWHQTRFRCRVSKRGKETSASIKGQELLHQLRASFSKIYSLCPPQTVLFLKFPVFSKLTHYILRRMMAKTANNSATYIVSSKESSVTERASFKINKTSSSKLQKPFTQKHFVNILENFSVQPHCGENMKSRNSVPYHFISYCRQGGVLQASV